MERKSPHTYYTHVGKSVGVQVFESRLWKMCPKAKDDDGGIFDVVVAFFFNDDDDDDDESLLNVFGFESNWIPRDDHRVQFC